MSIKLRAGVEPLELHFWWEEPRGRRVAPLQLFEAQRLVARLARQGQGQALRRLAAAYQPMLGLDDRASFALISRWIASGTLRLATVAEGPLVGRDESREEAAPAELPWIAPRRAPEEPAPVEQEEAIPPAFVEMAAQARVLREAAEAGTPLCEECEKPRRRPGAPPPEAEADDVAKLDQRSQAETLVYAAAQGIPFCEECQKSADGSG